MPLKLRHPFYMTSRGRSQSVRVRLERLLAYFVGPSYFFFEDLLAEDLVVVPFFAVVVVAFLAVVFFAPPLVPDDLLADLLGDFFVVVAILRSCSFFR